MKIVSPGHEPIYRNQYSPSQFIEKIGRVCYKSEDKITDTSAKEFVQMLINRGHTSVLEHYWVHFTFAKQIMGKHFEDALHHIRTYSRSNCVHLLDRFMEITNTSGQVFVSMPIRVLVDFVRLLQEDVPLSLNQFLSVFTLNFPDMFPATPYVNAVDTLGYYLVDDEKEFSNSIRKMMVLDNAGSEDIDHEIMRHRTHTVRFICDRGISHELVRHRVCSFSQESTRYCNYALDKFGSEISVIKPQFESDFYVGPHIELAWRKSCEVAEQQYFELLILEVPPQMARSVLPTCLKTEIVITTNEIEWQHIINLRYKGTNGTPHPQMVEIMKPWYQDLYHISRGRIK